ncbi:acetolactate synthase small subunit [Staphylococcus massiliensis]|uniref:Acetolactate synthase small subunit n=1 Tax=Staphylococcus massiliensis S46 TaxID=1229783 RepID=K9AY54_9STAP|nr:acetolactate synthase small subunit [Staphylococcus massiliensis]EKU46420.1 acetolactate synthase small subunit [Staphylococcus massiliensis S46]MCG3399868.1 acetolactate synthase small subunit [Staphylococcus massiliensis]MCG3402868.1 acetolactate synthase small subunit [Staphylococcus massiliensis]MCG3413055.1 acetolactate synthase small subunit [Staphylococcus massiliensis]PNZ99024.1 acetolactate synthase small subunit [Staphylococcus massiliensis CCUG 55927]
MRRTFKVQVVDEAGTLNRLTSIFVRRQFNIITLSATPTTQEKITEITFVAEIEDENVRTLILQLEKQINVLKVEDITDTNTYNRELLLVKLNTPKDKEAFYKVIKPYDALVSILKDDQTHLYLQAFGPPYTMNNLLDDLTSFDIEQVSRTGSAGLI